MRVSCSAPFHIARRARLLWRRRLARLALILAGCAVACAGFASPAMAQQPKAEEYQVKAVYLYNFGRFVEWPASAKKGDSFAICVLGRDPFGAALDTTLAGAAIDNQKLVARRIASAREATNCRILFISASESAHGKDILSGLEKAAVLTVSDMPGFASNGGMIQFVLQENKVRFEVNLTAAEKAGLSFSSQLLKVATDIKKEPGGADVKK
jgi:YfiR/HmsC-like